MYQVMWPLSFSLPQLEKNPTWKTNRFGGPKGREWRQQALRLEVRHIQSWWNHESWWELSSRPSLSICIQRLWLCCPDYKEIQFLVWRLSRCIFPPVSKKKKKISFMLPMLHSEKPSLVGLASWNFRQLYRSEAHMHLSFSLQTFCGSSFNWFAIFWLLFFLSSLSSFSLFLFGLNQINSKEKQSQINRLHKLKIVFWSVNNEQRNSFGKKNEGIVFQMRIVQIQSFFLFLF